MITPYFERAPRGRLYHADSRAIWPLLVAGGDGRGVVMFDPQYSEHVHTKSRAGARKSPLHNGDGRVLRASITRTKEFGFEAMTAADRAIFAVAAAAMTTRWCLVFSDIESCHLWRTALTSAGLEYVRTAIWHKIGGTPQFTGDRPAVGCEAITICHVPGVTKRWNGGGSHGWYEHPLTFSHQIVVEHGGSKEGEPRVHETQKPEALMLELVELFTEPDELVIDLTAGSSTTLVAAIRRGRRGLGVERREKDVETGARRIEAELAGVSYYARKSGQVGLFEQQEGAL